MRLGSSPINWSNEDLRELGGDIPLEQCLREMQLAGYEGTEYGYKLPVAAEDCCTVLADYELDLASCWHSFDVVAEGVEAALPKLEGKITFLAGVGADCVNLCDTSRTVHRDRDAPLSARPVFSDTEWDRLVDGLHRAGDLCAARGIRPAYHFHMGTGVQTADEVDRLMEMTDPGKVWLCADSGHAAYAGADPTTLFDTYAARMGHVHLKDLRPDVLARALADDCSFLTAVVNGVFTVPGDGAIEFPPLIDALHRAGYAAWVIVEAEQYLPGLDPFSFAQQCHDYLRALLETA